MNFKSQQQQQTPQDSNSYSSYSPALREGGTRSHDQDEDQGQGAISLSVSAPNQSVMIHRQQSTDKYFMLKARDFRTFNIENRFKTQQKNEKTLIPIEELIEYKESGEFESLKSIFRTRIKIFNQMKENYLELEPHHHTLAEQLQQQYIMNQRQTSKAPQWIKKVKNKQIQDIFMEVYNLYEKVTQKEKNNPEEECEGEIPQQDESALPPVLFDISVVPSQEEKDEEEIDDPTLRRMMQTYCKYSLSKYEITHPLRMFCIKTYEWPWFDRIIIFLIAINSLMLGFMDYTYIDGTTDKPMGNKLVDNSEILFTIFFTFECFVKIMALGLIMEKGCYLRDAWNWLDFIVVVAALIQNLNIVSNVSSLRTFRLFRPLRSLSAVPSMKILVNTLFQSSGQLVYIIVLDMFFILTFAIFGLQMWGGVMHFRCRETLHPVDGDWKVVKGDNRICGSFHKCNEGNYCGSLFETSLPDENGNLVHYELLPEVRANLDRDNFILDLNYGLTNFDNIGYSFLAIFQCTSLEGWTTIMMHIQDGYSMIASSIFFVVLVIICSYLLINLTVAVMHDNFLYLNQEKSDEIILQYEINQEKILVYKKLAHFFTSSAVKKRKSLKSRALQYLKMHVFKEFELPEKLEQGIPSRYDRKECLICWQVINHPIFNFSILILIILNTLILATDSYPSHDIDFISKTSSFFIVCFSLECILKLIGLDLEDYLEDRFNIFDLVIVLFSIVELFFQESGSKSGFISALRAFRLFRLIKLVRSNQTLAALVDSIVHTIAAIGNFLVLLSIFIYVFALLGMSNFAGKFRFNERGEYDPNGEVPRQNFDSIFWAVVTVFQILIGDEWNQVMYKAIISTGHSSINFFIMLVLVGNFIMFNLFLAILLGNFEQASLLIKSNVQKKILDEITGKNKSSPSVKQASEKSPECCDKNQPSPNQVAPFAELVQNSPNKLGNGDAANETIGQVYSNIKGDSPSFMHNGSPVSDNEVKVNSFNLTDVINQVPMMEIEAAPESSRSIDNQAGGTIVQPEQVAQVRMYLNIAKNNTTLETPDTIEKDKINFSQTSSISAAELNSSSESKKIQATLDKKIFKKSVTVSPININTESEGVTPVDFISTPPILKSKSLNSGTTTSENKKYLGQKLHQARFQLGGIESPQILSPSSHSLKDSSFDSSVDLEAQSNQKNNPRKQRQVSKLNLVQEQVLESLSSSRDADTNRMMVMNQPEFVRPKLNLVKSESEPFAKITILKEKEKKGVMFELPAEYDPSPTPTILQLRDSITESFYESAPYILIKRVCKFMSESSLFILHKDTMLRQFLLKLTTNQSIAHVCPHEHEHKKEEDQDSYGLEYDHMDEHQDFSAKQAAKMFQSQKVFSKNIFISGRVQPDKSPGGDSLQIRSPGTSSPWAGLRSEQVNAGFTTPLGMIRRAQSFRQTPKAEFEDLILDEEVLQQKIEKIIEEDDGPITDLQNVLDQEVNSKLHHIKNLQSVGKVDHRLAIKSQNKIELQRENFQMRLEKQKIKLQFLNKVRKGYKIVSKKCFCLNWSLNNLFENMIYLIIFTSMILLIVDGPQLDPDGHQAQINRKLDDIISTIFIIEVLLRIFAIGFFTSSIPGQKGYITKDSNKIDFFVSIGCDTVIFLWKFYGTDKSFDISTLRTLKVLRSLRALRPLRIISKNEGLKLAVSSLFTALPAIANGILICTLVIFIYAIIGISLFKGQFYYCDFILESKIVTKQRLSTIETKEQCLHEGGEWINRDRHFDNIFSALSVLQEIITTEGWLDVMYFGIDASGIDKQPKRDNSLMSSLFFISFIITGNIFVLNLFVGIVIDKFNRLKDKICGYMMMTRFQKDWVELEKQMVRLEIEPFKNPPENPQRLLAYKIQCNKNFENFIYFCMFLSTLQMALRFYQMNETYSLWLDILNYVFTLIYNLEAALKIFACGHNYFLNNWNRFDFFIVIVGDLSIFADVFDQGKTDISKILRIIKALRIMRIFRLVRVSRKLRILVDSIIVIFPSIANIGSLIMLLLFIFSVIGMSLFSEVIHQTQINENMNFSNFSMSIIILIRCATGENWNIIMRELAIQPDRKIKRFLPDGSIYIENCKMTQTWEEIQLEGPKQCGSNISFIYFGFFIVIIQFLTINLFVAVVLEGFSSTNKEHIGFIHSLHFEELLEKWTAFDEDATGWIKMEDICFLVNEVDYPLGRMTEFDQEVEISTQFVKNNSKIIDQSSRFFTHIEKNMTVRFSRALKLMMELQLPVYSGIGGQYQCHFSDVVKALSQVALKKENANYDNSGIEKRHVMNLQAKWEIRYPDLQKRKPIPELHSGKVLAGTFIVQCMKNIALNQKIKQLQNQAFNIKAIQEKNLQNMLELKRKSCVLDHLKLEKQMTSYIMKNTQSPMSIIDHKHFDIQKILTKHEQKSPIDCSECEEKVQDIKENLGFSFQLIGDKDFSKKIEEIFYKGETYKKLGIRMHQNPRNSEVKTEKVKRKKDQEIKTYTDPEANKDYERSTWWTDDPDKNYKMKQFVKNLDYKAQKQKDYIEEEKYHEDEEQEQEQEEQQSSPGMEQTGGFHFVKRKETFGEFKK